MSDHLEPGPPRLQPMAAELLDACACLIVEADTYRDRLGLPPLGGRRKFTAEDRRKGHSLGPLALLDDEGLVIRLEN